MDNFNILFTSAGRRVSLIRYFRESINSLQLPGKIITADFQKNAPAHFIGDCQELVPLVNHPDYIKRLLELCERHRVKLLIPLIDTELSLLAHHKQDFEAIGVTPLVSSIQTNEICIDKRNTYDFFNQIGVDTPEIFLSEVILNAPQVNYPLIIKPADGSSSVGVTKIRNFHELKFFQDYIPNAIVQEFVIGQEYTIDFLVDFQGVVQVVVPRMRLETRAGEISKGITVKNYELIYAGKKVVNSLPGAVGCITVQCFLEQDGNIKFIEINPRFGGGFPLAYQAGADFPTWIIQMILGTKPEVSIDGWQDGLTMLRYDEAIFIPQEF